MTVTSLQFQQGMMRSLQSNIDAASQKIERMNGFTVQALDRNQAEIDRTVEKIKQRAGPEPGPLSRGMMVDVEA